MLSRNKFAQLAAVAALTVLFGANASMSTANAQAGAQADQKNMQHSRKGDVRHSSTTARAQAQTEQNTQKSRKSDTKRSSSRKVGHAGHNYEPWCAWCSSARSSRRAAGSAGAVALTVC